MKKPKNDLGVASSLPCYLLSREIFGLARGIGATTKEARSLSALYDLEGFGGLECNPCFSPSEVVLSALERWRELSGKRTRPMVLAA